MKIIRQLIHPLYDCEAAAFFLLRRLKVNVTRSALSKSFLEHPDYPSLLSISDVLSYYNVANTALKLPADQLSKLSEPFIAVVSGSTPGRNIFSVITRYTGEEVELYMPGAGRVELITKEAFEKSYSGTVLIAEANEASGEEGYAENLTRERSKYAVTVFSILALPLITIAACVAYLLNTTVSSALAPVSFTLVTLLGVLVTAALLWYEANEYNPIAKQICQAGTKVNCSAILNSRASKIMGISWTNIGFTYFTGMLVSLLVSGISPSALAIAGVINMLAVPYVLFSLYYQWRLARQWCILCVFVQALLLLQLLITVAGQGLSISPVLSFSYFASAIPGYVLAFIAVSLLMTSSQASRHYKQKAGELLRLKHNPQIFESFLQKQKNIVKNTDGLGITLGNMNGKYKLVKVCNPYCSPCATAHSVLEELVENNPEIGIQIIFNSTLDDADIRKDPSMHLLSISDRGDNDLTRKALDEWYRDPQKDYAAFAKRFPSQITGDVYAGKIKAMSDWCDATDISYTPTIFLNGYQLPQLYNVRDLKYFLSE